MKYRANFLFASSKFSHVFGDGGTPDGKAILKGLLSTVYKLDDAKISEILKDGATPEEIQTAIEAVDVARVKKIQTDAQKGKLQEGYNKAMSEALTKKEVEYKEHYGIESDLTGIELIEHIVKTKAGEGAAKNDEDIKKSSLYQQLDAKYKKDVAEARKAGEEAVKKITEEHAKASTNTKVNGNAMDLLPGLNPVFSQNPVVAQTQRKNFTNSLHDGFTYEEKEGKILVLKEGQLHTDEHGHTVEFADHVKTIAGTHFEFAANNGGGNAGNGGAGDKGKGGNAGGNGGGAAAYPAGVTKPKNQQELAVILDRDDLKPAQKRVVIDTYRAENGQK